MSFAPSSGHRSSVRVVSDTTHAGGWDYSDPSHNSIQLYGQLCQDVMSGAVQVVNVVYACIIG